MTSFGSHFPQREALPSFNLISATEMITRNLYNDETGILHRDTELESIVNICDIRNLLLIAAPGSLMS